LRPTPLPNLGATSGLGQALTFAASAAARSARPAPQDPARQRPGAAPRAFAITSA